MSTLKRLRLVEELKKQGSKIPVVIMSNLSQEIDRKRATDAGAVAYFVKSDIKLFEVVAFIKKTLKI